MGRSVFDGFSPQRLSANYLLRLRSRGLDWAASKSRDVHDLSIATIQALERIAKRSGPLLRLPDEVEAEYRREWRITANHVRVMLCALPVVVFGALILGAEGVLGMPSPLIEQVKVTYVCVILPLALVPTTIGWLWPQSSLTGAALAFAGLGLVITLEVLRAHAAMQGYVFDHSVLLCVPIGLIVLGGFRFDRVAILVAGYIAVALVAALTLDAPVREPTAWVGEIVLLLMSAAAALWMETTQRRSWAARRLLQLQAHQDPLTGLRNRRSFELHYEIAAAQARRESKRLFFALADLDHFKRVNDRYGHDYGDGALSEVAVVLSQFGRRPLDAVARLGGEEFAILLYDCDATGAQTRLQELVDQVRALGIDNEDAPLHVLTISAGGVVSDGSLPMSELYHSADNHLYAVKHRGRNGARVGPILSD